MKITKPFLSAIALTIALSVPLTASANGVTIIDYYNTGSTPTQVINHDGQPVTVYDGNGNILQQTPGYNTGYNQNYYNPNYPNQNTNQNYYNPNDGLVTASDGSRVKAYTPTPPPVLTEQQVDAMKSQTNLSVVKMYGEALTSSDNETRANALNSTFGSDVQSADAWQDKSLTDNTYTSHVAINKDFTHYINSNRESLIQYGWRTNDWQPHRWFTAMSEPAFFDIDKTTGNLEFNKLYWAKMADWLLVAYRSDYANATTEEGKEKYRKLYTEHLFDYVDKYNKAPGLAVKSQELNRNQEVRAITGAIPFDVTTEGTVWDSRELRVKGVFPDGYNPWSELRQKLNKGETITTFVHKYHNANAQSLTGSPIDSLLGK